MIVDLLKSIVLLVALLALTACATETRVSKLSSQYPAKPEGCDIRIYKDLKPDNAYDVVGKLESHMQRNFFLGGKVTLDGEGFQELKQKGCELGGDAIIIDDSMESSVSEVTHIHVWATVVKFASEAK
ncbi:MAG: hypothetical protein PHF56_24320 [Desulfuromonadaceae bacterium]|nr:hypothetical protein [Desulfuromonadaceae bacterium]